MLEKITPIPDAEWEHPTNVHWCLRFCKEAILELNMSLAIACGCRPDIRVYAIGDDGEPHGLLFEGPAPRCTGIEEYKTAAICHVARYCEKVAESHAAMASALRQACTDRRHGKD